MTDTVVVAPSRTQRRRERTRAALIEAAASCYATKGVDATTVADITDAADIGVGTFYVHFPSKDEIADAVIDQMATLLTTELRAATSDVDDAADALASFVLAIFAWYEREPVWGPFLLEVGVQHEALVERFGGILLELLVRGKESGRFVGRHVELAAVSIAGLVVSGLGFRRLALLGEDAAAGLASHALRLVGIDAVTADAIADARRSALRT